jgi:hypothetical protein
MRQVELRSGKRGTHERRFVVPLSSTSVWLVCWKLTSGVSSSTRYTSLSYSTHRSTQSEYILSTESLHVHLIQT